MGFLNEKFSFDGISSDDMGVILISIDSNGLNDYGMKTSVSINEEKTNVLSEPFYVGEEKEVPSINICLTAVDKAGQPVKMDYQKRRDIMKWLFQKDYKPFITMDSPEVIYYVKFTESQFVSNGSQKGYLNLTVRMNSPYVYSPIYTYTTEVTMEENEKVIEIDNTSNLDEYYYPAITIRKTQNNGMIEIENLSHKGETFMIVDIQENEVINIDCQYKTVFNSRKQPRVRNCNRNWLRLKYGINRIKVIGECEIEIKCQYPQLI